VLYALHVSGRRSRERREYVTGYCLNVIHPRGQHKARVFASALGLTAEDAEFLRDALLNAAKSYDAVPNEEIECQ
jgi:hypothetical protein